MASVKQLCTRGIILSNGCVVFDGEIEETITRYLKNEKQNIESDLQKITNRSGSRNVEFIEFYIENNKGDRIDNVLNGDFVKLCFKIKVNVEKIMKLDIGFSIHTDRDELYTVLYSSYQNKTIETKGGGQYVVKCGISDFMLNQGEYTVRGRILSDGSEADWVKESIGKINVIKGDFYNTGNVGFVGNSKVLIKGKWDIES